MFGFGKRSKVDDLIVSNLMRPLAAVLGAAGEVHKLVASHLEEVRSELKGKGLDPYKNDTGDLLITENKVMAPRLAAGLTAEDVQQYWNRPLLQIYTERKLKETLALIYIRTREVQGSDPAAASREWKINNPIYGEPKAFDPADGYSKDQFNCHASLFWELEARVIGWSVRTPQESIEIQVMQHGTYNAMVRALVHSNVL